ncbi:regulatory protein RecX [Thiotrichales bacterium HSG1]|nr:regulatory protein RecX [Thiotrichales bacterium HSG1]
MNIDPSSYNQIRRCAMDYLARREHASLELKNKLLRKGFMEDIIDEVLYKLTIDKLLSDERFAESYIRYRTKKGFGPIKIKQELQQRGINSELTSEQLGNNDDFWVTQVRHAHTKKFRSNLPQNNKELAKQMLFLQNRGFTSSQIRTMFDELSKISDFKK